MQYTMRGETYELPENTSAGLRAMSENQDEVRRVRWLAENSHNEDVKRAARELMGAYDFARQRNPETRRLYSDELFAAIHRFLAEVRENKGRITSKFLVAWTERFASRSVFQLEAYYFGCAALFPDKKPSVKPDFLTDGEEARILKQVKEREELYLHQIMGMRAEAKAAKSEEVEPVIESVEVEAATEVEPVKAVFVEMSHPFGPHHLDPIETVFQTVKTATRPFTVEDVQRVLLAASPDDEDVQDIARRASRWIASFENPYSPANRRILKEVEKGVFALR